MSRVAKVPVKIPTGVDVSQANNVVTVKGAKGSLSLALPKAVSILIENGEITVTPESMKINKMESGTVRALLANYVQGVSKGYERKLQLVGVGYRASLQGKVLNLAVGLSHPVNIQVPEGITIEVPSQTEILIKGASKHMVGQVAADIRSYRPPEPYKGKGVRYSDERVELKEAKKK